MGQTTAWPEALPRPVYKTLTRMESLDPWFEIYEVSRRIYAIYEPLHFEEAISFLILGDERGVLLDTGMGVGDIQAEVKNLTSLPTVVVNTHTHYDHVGGNYQFVDVWAFDNDFEIARAERGLTVEEIAHEMAPGLICGPLPVGFDPSTYQIRGSKVTRRLRHLEEIELGNRTLVVHHTPGHSPGSLCLYDQRDGILFTGDLYYPGTLYAHPQGSNPDEYVESLKYLAAMADDVSFVAPSHNEPEVPTQEILDARDGFLKIQSGEAEYTVQDDTRLYRFERFKVEYPHR